MAYPLSSRNRISICTLVIVTCFGCSSCGIAYDHQEEMIVDDALESIAVVPLVDEPIGVRLLTRTEAEEDLDQLGEYIRTRHSYVYSTDFDYGRAIEFLKTRLSDTVSVPVFALQIHKLVQHLGDNHAKLSGWMDYLPERFVPFSFGFKAARVFAFHRDRSNLIDESHPYVRSIDGIPIDRWVERAGDITSGPDGSDSQRWQRLLDLLEYIDFMRSEIGLPNRDDIEVILESEDGADSSMHFFSVADERNETGKPFGLSADSRIMEKNIGYLRIHSQRNDELTREIPGLMEGFRGTDALIIDARQCGGGLRSNLQVLFPYFMSPDDRPYIANVAKLRIPQGHDDFDPRGKLDVDDKKLKYREDIDVTVEERLALDEFLASFSPQWQPPEDRFTDWYFMAMVDREDTYHYDRPVFLIMDWGVGSAGDIFVSAFKGWRNVTLAGTASNGRSGNSRDFVLQNSGLPVRLSTMASFQKTGEKYDGVGIHPDIVVEAEISDWLEQSDTVLDSVWTLAVDSILVLQ